MIFIILGARDQDIHNKREDYTAIRRSISQIQNDLTVFMKVQSFRGAHGPLARLAPASLLKDSPTCRQVYSSVVIPTRRDGRRIKRLRHCRRPCSLNSQ